MKPQHLAADVSLWGSVIGLSILLGATVFQMMVIVPEFERDLPRGMVAFAATGILPVRFWGSGVTGFFEMLPLLALALNWRTPRRTWMLIATGFYVVTVVWTIAFFYPRLVLMGLVPGSKPVADPVLLSNAVSEWVLSDRLRFWLTIVPAFLASLKALATRLEPR